MVRVEIRPSGRYQYAVVVDDYQENGRWKKKVVRSYGNIADERNLHKAHQFAAAVNAGKSFLAAELEVNKDDLKAALTILAGAAIAGAALGWLLGEE